MTIKDIARLANVSASTVSKIINGKHSGIRPETAERVLDIVKEYQYRPYERVHMERGVRSFLIGILIGETSLDQRFLTSLLETARRRGYSTIVCTSKTGEEEYKGLRMMLKHNVDGIIWEPMPDSVQQCADELSGSGVPVQKVDVRSGQGTDGTTFDYQRLGYLAMEVLMRHKHKRVMCLMGHLDNRLEPFRAGCEQCMFDHQAQSSNLICHTVDDGEADELIPFDVTGVVCASAALCARVCEEANRTNRRIPKDLSVVSLEETEEYAAQLQGIITIRLPYTQLGEYACERLIRTIEGDHIASDAFAADYRLSGGESVDVPTTCRGKKIVVVGTLNMDTLITIEEFPVAGETLRAVRRATMPGGKGINQAIGAAKMGAEVYLIGMTGKDYDGGKLFHFLKRNDVNTGGILTTDKSDTGHAYIYVQEDGESSIVIYDGANRWLTREQILGHEQMFENASFCLLQTELDAELVAFTAALAKKRGCKVLLKPAVVDRLDDALLRNVDILLPNEREISVLMPGEETLEEKARYFLDRGVGTVIITLGNRGGYYCDGAHCGYFAAADFVPVDTTGAADVFCATLAVYLSQNYDLPGSIRHANMAAGYSTTHFGAAPSFSIDKQMLDFMVEGQEPR